MIIINNETGFQLETNNKSLAARIIGYHRNSISNWSKKYAKKEAKDIKGNIAFTIYFNREIHKI